MYVDAYSTISAKTIHICLQYIPHGCSLDCKQVKDNVNKDILLNRFRCHKSVFKFNALLNLTSLIK